MRDIRILDIGFDRDPARAAAQHWMSTVPIRLAPRLVRLRRLHPEDAQAPGGGEAGAMALSPTEKRALRVALLGMGAVVALFLAAVLVPGAPLHGVGKPTLPNGRVMATQAVTVLPADTPMAEGALVLTVEYDPCPSSSLNSKSSTVILPFTELLRDLDCARDCGGRSSSSGCPSSRVK